MLSTLLTGLTLLIPPDTAKHVFFTGDAGLIATSGNTNVTTIDVGEKLVLVWRAWKFTENGGVTYARTEDSVTAQLWHGAVRGDRSLSKRIALYLLVEFERNTFAGISGRNTPSFGLSILAVSTARDTLRAEIGGAYTAQEAPAPGVDRHYGAGRVAVTYHRRLGAKSSFDEAVEYLPNFETGADYRIASSTSITAPITTGIAMKAAYVIRYEGLPEPGFVKTDRMFTSGLQITL